MGCHTDGIPARYDLRVMDALPTIERLPQLGERASRLAVGGWLTGGHTTRCLVDDALIRFERAVQSAAPSGVRPAPLFTERDRIVSELRRFVRSSLAARLLRLPRRDLLAAGRGARPFDAIVRGRRGRGYGIVLRRIPPDGRRLELLRRVAAAAASYTATPLAGVLIYDLSTSASRLVSDDACAERVDCDLRAS
jgi:hypothetical protein